jgi:hypothetical protein
MNLQRFGSTHGVPPHSQETPQPRSTRPQQYFIAAQVVWQLAGWQQPPCQQTSRPAVPQGEPLGAAGWVHLPAASQTSLVHWRLSLLQPVFTATGVWVQPVSGLHPSVVQGSVSAQLGAAPPVQTPATQASPVVQALPSLQPVPLGTAGFEHLPVAGAQVPALWQASEAVQVTGLAWLHLPPEQVSVPLHRSASAVQLLPPQQAWPWPPHRQLPLAQVRLLPQALPEVQQGWSLAPQGWQLPF